VVPERRPLADRRPADRGGPALRGLVMDWGGVMTGGMDSSVAAWTAAHDVDPARFEVLMHRWAFARPSLAGSSREANPVHALERGQIEVAEFERRVAAELTTRSGAPVAAAGMLGRMLAGMHVEPDMVGLVGRARGAGVRTALLSNSWGTGGYQRDGWEQLFDVVVLSGDVGMRKPDADIFHHTLGLLSLPAADCVFVDDIGHNVDAAAALGFVGVRHTSYAQTAAELERLFGTRLSA
jgi:epoxide hydrolase-like predicted phosphatase